MNYNENYLYKIQEGFDSIEYHLDILKELLSEDINNNNIGIVWRYHNMNVKDFYFSLFEIELRLRALRDKLENG